MTASKENLGGVGKTSKVISSTLAGVLAVGMIPAAGFAAEAADEGTSDADIDLLSVEEATAIAQGSITGAVNAQDQSISNLENITFTAATDNAGNPVKYLVTPTQVTSSIGTVYDLTDKEASYASDFVITYYKVDDTKATTIPGTTEKGETIKAAQSDAGTYYSVVTYGSNEAILVLKWSIVGASLEGATIFNDDSDNDGTADDGKNNTANTSFVYDAAEQVAGFALNGKVLTETTDYTVNYQGMGVAASPTVPTAAGNYQAVLTGAGIYKGSEATINFTISPFDISGATITVTPDDGANTATIATLNGESSSALLTALNTAAKATLTSDKIYEADNLGAYTYAVALNSGVTNFTGSQSVVYDNVGTDATFSYAGAAWASASVTTDLSAKAPQLFSANNVKVTYKTDGSEAEVPASAVSYIVTDAKGNPATIADVTTPGTWKVIAKVDAKAMNYAVGGQSSAMTVTVTNGTIDCSENLYIDYDGTLPSSNALLSAVYTGSNLLPNLNIKLVDNAGNTLTQGTDYTVKIVNADGDTVNEIVNAGDYEITVESKSWKLTENTATTLTVDPIKAVNVQLAGTSTIDGISNAYSYTGSDIIPALEYLVTKNNDGTNAVKDSNGKDTYAPLPSDYYKLAIKYAGAASASVTSAPGTGYDETVTSLKDPGWYQVTATAETVTPSNYAFTGPLEVEVYVSAYKPFQDVPSDAWFAPYVAAANELNYMKGYNGSDFFGPYDKMKRGDVALVLYRMSLSNEASGDGVSPRAATFNDDYFNDNAGYDTPFADVDSHMYYARAIAWASNTGIVTGYAGTDNFGPEDSVTREQFATMLGRFAQKAGNFEVEDADAALASYADGAQVDAWAKDYVAWAIENKIMGNNPTLNPLDDIIRAEIAKMVVVYQPENNTFIQ